MVAFIFTLKDKSVPLHKISGTQHNIQVNLMILHSLAISLHKLKTLHTTTHNGTITTLCLEA